MTTGMSNNGGKQPGIWSRKATYKTNKLKGTLG